MPRYIAGLDLIVTPSDVKALEAKVNNDFLTLQASVDTSNLASDLLAAWNGFTAEWKGWLAANPDIGTLPITYLQQKHELTDFEVRLQKWEPTIKAARGGNLAGPSIQPTGGQGIAHADGGLLTGLGIGAAVAVVALLLLRR